MIDSLRKSLGERVRRMQLKNVTEEIYAPSASEDAKGLGFSRSRQRRPKDR